MRSMRSGGGAVGPVVLGPHRIVVSPEVAAVAAVVVPIVGRALVVLITRGPHRCESNDATPDRDRARGTAPTPRTEDRSGFLDCRTCPYRPPSPTSRDWIVLTPEPLPSDAALAWASDSGSRRRRELRRASSATTPTGATASTR